MMTSNVIYNEIYSRTTVNTSRRNQRSSALQSVRNDSSGYTSYEPQNDRPVPVSSSERAAPRESDYDDEDKDSGDRSVNVTLVAACIVIYFTIIILLIDRQSGSCLSLQSEDEGPDDVDNPPVVSPPSEVPAPGNTTDGKDETKKKPTTVEEEIANTETSKGPTLYSADDSNVFQRRFNGQTTFHDKTWNEYKNGFGNTANEFWLGLQEMHEITKEGRCGIRVELGGFDRSFAWAEYSKFIVGPEEESFPLQVSGYSGTAGNALTYSVPRWNANKMKFTTVDQDNDRFESNCAEDGAGGWWYNNCGLASPNGERKNEARPELLNWHTWKRNIGLNSSVFRLLCR